MLQKSNFNFPLLPIATQAGLKIDHPANFGRVILHILLSILSTMLYNKENYK